MTKINRTQKEDTCQVVECLSGYILVKLESSWNDFLKHKFDIALPHIHFIVKIEDHFDQD